MSNINQTLQIVSIQHELSMQIGLDMDLDIMLDIFMQRLLQRLSLHTVKVLHNLKKESDEHFNVSFPKSSNTHISKNLLQNAKNLYFDTSEAVIPIENDQGHFYLFVIPNFGILILERQHQQINDKIIDAITALMTKLSVSCIACLQHKSLLVEVESRKAAETRLITQSLTDSLTGLANRKAFDIELDRHIRKAEKYAYFGAVFIIDLDRFKIINDSLGHTFGDQVLQAVSQRLLLNLPNKEMLGRFGGDEFVLLAPNLHTNLDIAKEKANMLAEKLRAAFTNALDVMGQKVTLTISLGIQLYPLCNEKFNSYSEHKQTVMKHADLAMSTIKKDSKNGFLFYNKEIHAVSERRLAIEKALASAIEQDEFELYFQAIVDSNNISIGAEALIRWNSQSLGWVNPGEFISIAEECGQIAKLGNWVIEQACKFYKEVEATNSKNFKYISVNISTIQFAHHEFENQLLNILAKHKVKPQSIRLEITEGIAFTNIQMAVSKMQNLVKKGFDFMLDDFGSGYSSLSYIHKLPLHTVKIDRAFICDIHKLSNNQVIVRAIIDICAHFELECVAEGVEVKEEKSYLNEHGSLSYQGYYFARPVPGKVFLETLNTQSKPAIELALK